MAVAAAAADAAVGPSAKRTCSPPRVSPQARQTMGTGVASAETNRKHRALQGWLDARPAGTVPTTRGTEERFWTFIRTEFIPAVCRGRLFLKALYGKITEMYLRVRKEVVIPESYWHGQNKLALRSFAVLSGLGFLVLLRLKQTQHHAHLIAPMLPVSGIDAVCGSGRLEPCLGEVTTQLMEACWTRGPSSTCAATNMWGPIPGRGQ